jgi:hypothetical protein
VIIPNIDEKTGEWQVTTPAQFEKFNINIRQK